MTDHDRARAEQDHTAIAQILAIVRAMVERANLHDHRLAGLDDKLEHERRRGEMRDRELVAVGRRIDDVHATVGRIETSVSTLVEQLRQQDRVLGDRITTEAKRPRQWLGVTLDGGAAKVIGAAVVGGLMVLAARAGWRLPPWLGE